MSWQLLFFRRVGEPTLTLSELDAYFARHPHTRRFEGAESAAAGNEVRYEFSAAGPTPVFAFTYLPGEHFEPNEPPQPDFPYEQTQLLLEMDCDLSRPGETIEFTRLVAEVEAISQDLGLLVLDPQMDQEIPGPPYPDRLERSYRHRCSEIAETIRYFEARRRRMLLTGAALLFAAVILGVLALFSSGG